MEPPLLLEWDNDDEDSREVRFLRTRPTRDLKETLVDQISSDREARLEGQYLEQATTSREVPIYGHNIATMWTALKSQIGSPLKQGPLGKA